MPGCLYVMTFLVKRFDREGERRIGDPMAYHYINQNMWWTGGYQGHTICSYPKLLTMGLDGVLEQIDFYDNKVDPSDKKKKD